MTALRIGTRGSKLALTRTGLVVDRLRTARPGVEIVIVTITTPAGRGQSAPLSSGEGAGWRTAAIQQALASGEIDIAIHNYKDLPTKRPVGLVIASVPLREDSREALVSRHPGGLHELPPGSVVGTSSPRREAQVREVRPDVAVRPIRGGVETRVAQVDAGEYDATVLELAGLRQLGIESRAGHAFGFEEMLPAPAQGALAAECRADDVRTRALLESIDNPAIRVAVTAERVFLATIDGGCGFPAAAHAEQFGTTLKLAGLIAVDGRIIRSKMAGPVATAGSLGRALAEELMALGGQR